MIIKIQDFFRNVKYYLINIIKWSPILWKDRDWDDYYIMDTLRFKIENTAKYIRKNKRYIGYERDVERMNLVVRLIDKFQDEFYNCEYQDYYKSDFSFKRIKDSELFEMESEIKENNLLNYFEKYPNTYRKIYPNCDNEDIRIALKMGHHLHNKAKRILFTLIERNIEKWWD